MNISSVEIYGNVVEIYKKDELYFCKLKLENNLLEIEEFENIDVHLGEKVILKGKLVIEKFEQI